LYPIDFLKLIVYHGAESPLSRMKLLCIMVKKKIFLYIILDLTCGVFSLADCNITFTCHMLGALSEERRLLKIG